MIVNGKNLRSLYVSYSALFAGVLAAAKPQWNSVAMQVNSTTSITEYGWLGEFPQVREWIGDRVVNGLATHGYAIKNKSFELTVGVLRDDIEDDNVGIYTPMIQNLARSFSEHYDKSVFAALKDGFTQPCYDGQPFFDDEHPRIADDGDGTTLWSNFGGGSGTPWYLIDDTRALKPVILQVRKPPEFVAMDDIKDQNVFTQKKFLYGVDSRDATGYGLPHLAYASRQPLTVENYEAARSAMMSLKGDHGRQLGITPTLLVVPPTLEGAARRLLLNEKNAAGADNEWFQTAKPVVVPWLA